MRLYLMLIEDVAHRALSQLGKASVPLRRPMLTRMAGEQAAIDHFNRDPVVHTWSYKLDQAA